MTTEPVNCCSEIPQLPTKPPVYESSSLLAARNALGDLQERLCHVAELFGEPVVAAIDGGRVNAVHHHLAQVEMELQVTHEAHAQADAEVDRMAEQLSHCLQEITRRATQWHNRPQGVQLIEAERVRQIAEEGWSVDHDDAHDSEQLAKAAAAYALPPSTRQVFRGRGRGRPAWWPWQAKWWKPGDRKRELVKAGALIAAELERVMRAELREEASP